MDTELNKIALGYIDKQTDSLHSLSKEIWDNPELAYKEFRAHDVISNFLENHGFKVTRKYKLETAFLAEYSVGDVSSPHIAVLCEYDALPGIGHACGHNLIAEVGVAAGIAIKAAMESSGKTLGKVRGWGKVQGVSNRSLQIYIQSHDYVVLETMIYMYSN